jgi:hypothetical protein
MVNHYGVIMNRIIYQVVRYCDECPYCHRIEYPQTFFFCTKTKTVFDDSDINKNGNINIVNNCLLETFVKHSNSE